MLESESAFVGRSGTSLSRRSWSIESEGGVAEAML
jgi:hypothetical protein